MKFFDADTIKVMGVSMFGFSINLADVNTVVHIVGGLATIAYISSKTYFMWRNKGEKKKKA